MEIVRPRYGAGSLADLVPSAAAAVGAPGFVDALGLGHAGAVCVLLIDGLGSGPLSRHAESAPLLARLSAARPPITTGFPSTTVTSLASVGTGLPPGEHGLVGYMFAVPGHDRPVNGLRWSLAGGGPAVDLRAELVPERFQPAATAFERAAGAGVAVTVIGPAQHARSGLTRAVLRGGRYQAAHSPGDLVWNVLDGLRAKRPALVYAYVPTLDLTEHFRGVDSEATALEFAQIDRLVEAIVDRLPEGSLLVVSGDHGLVDLRDDQKVEVAAEPGLSEGVRMISGEPRARHVHALRGAAGDVRAAWAERLGDRMAVWSRDEAIDEGWFGPSVPDRVRPRIGDVVAAAHGPVGVFDPKNEGPAIGLRGHHGGLTPDEMLVPLIVAGPDG